MRTLITLSVILLFIFTNQVNSQNVLVNPGAGSYATLKSAFDAVNAGTHTGAVTVDIVNNTTETATAVIQRSGSGLSNYSSVTVRPSGGVRTVQGNINGAIIKIEYADNITIDGRINGEGRNLIIINNNAGFNFTSCIWVASSGIGSSIGSRHNTVRNCELNCGANQLAFNLVTYGIVQSGTNTDINGLGGANNDSNFYLNNKIYKCYIGIALLAYVTNINLFNVISGNVIGSSAYNSDEIGKSGIFTLNQNYCEISGNEVMFIGGPRGVYGFGTDLIGIAVEKLAWDHSYTATNIGRNYRVMNNKIHDIKMEEGFSTAGIVAASSSDAGPTNNLIANNEIYNILSNGSNGRQIAGIGKISGTNDRIVYNSIYLTGDVDPSGTASSLDTCGGGILCRTVSSNDSAMLIANNSIYLDLKQNRDSIRIKTKYCILTPDPGYNWGTGGIKNNDYYFPAANTKMRTGGTGVATSITPYTTLTDWKTAYSPGQDIFSIQLNPAYAFNPSNYLIPLSSSSLLTKATPISSVSTDILGNSRSIITPTIGAYEKDSTSLNKIQVNFSGYIQGFYNNMTDTQVPDTIRVYLNNTITPFSAVDSSKVILSSGGSAALTFNNAPNGTYYIVFKHRNSIKTWSKSGGQVLNKGAMNSYVFSDLVTKAFGSNMSQIDSSPLRYGFYSGDIDQDGIVDASDLSQAENDAMNAVSGYVNTDVNGDDYVDAGDVSIVENNSTLGVAVIAP